MHNHRKAIKTLGDGNQEFFFLFIVRGQESRKKSCYRVEILLLPTFLLLCLESPPRNIPADGKASGLMEKNVLPRVKGNRVRTQKTASNERKLS